MEKPSKMKIENDASLLRFKVSALEKERQDYYLEQHIINEREYLEYKLAELTDWKNIMSSPRQYYIKELCKLVAMVVLVSIIIACIPLLNSALSNRNINYKNQTPSLIRNTETLKTMQIGEYGYIVDWFFNADYTVHRELEGTVDTYIHKISPDEFVVGFTKETCSQKYHCDGIYNGSGHWLRGLDE